MKILNKLIPILLVVFLLQSCNDNDDVVVIETQTIVDLASASPNLSSLATALQRADLLTTLEGNGPFTVLAPTNDAFDTFLAANNFATLNDVPVSLLTEVLLNHVISGALQSTDLSTGYANTLATSNSTGTAMSIYINTSNGVEFNGVSSVSTANIIADNGVIHIVNAVIGLPTVVTIATADPNFSNLATALTQENLLTALSSDAATAPAPFTVFAPTNSAFQNFIDEDTNDAFSSIGDVLALSTLSDVLTYHVLPNGAVKSTDIMDGITPTTLQGGTFTINSNMSGVSITDNNSRTVNIVATDVIADNGIIHVLDNVILP